MRSNLVVRVIPDDNGAVVGDEKDEENHWDQHYPQASEQSSGFQQKGLDEGHELQE